MRATIPRVSAASRRYPRAAVPIRDQAETRPRLAVRCDGSAEKGAGHVARCIPLARAFSRRGWSVTFVGRYGDLAAWLLDRAGQPTKPPEAGPCGVTPERWEAAIVDSYDVASHEVCELAGRLPVATLAEARRCEELGVLIDYHLDRIGERPGPRLLPGPAYAPLDPAFAGAGRAGAEIRAVLITVGGSQPALTHLPGLRAMARDAFPDAQQLVPRAARDGEMVALSEVVPGVDAAVTAAGVTAYELACAGVPYVAVGIAANQRRVLEGLRSAGLAPCVDLDAGESLDAVGMALERLRDPAARRSLSELGRTTFDGHGAERAMSGLLERWAVGAGDSSIIAAPCP